MRADKVGADTVLSQIVQLVAQAQRSRAPMQRMADEVSSWFVLAVLAIAAATLLVWGLLGPAPSWTYAVVNAVAVLIIACPCALGLATPMSIMVATGRAAQAGVLFRDAEAIERLRTIDTLIVDKTGTLTQGKPAFRDVIAVGDHDADDVLRLAASLEQGSEHPLAEPSSPQRVRRGLALEPQRTSSRRPASACAVVSRITRSSLGNDDADAGRRGGRRESREPMPSGCASDGASVMFLAVDGRVAGLIAVADPIKQTTRRGDRCIARGGRANRHGDGRRTCDGRSGRETAWHRRGAR